MKFAINNTITNSSKIISSYTILAILYFHFTFLVNKKEQRQSQKYR